MRHRPGRPRPARLVVVAKAPLPGVAKTRLTPPCTPDQAAAIAAASLADTLRAVAGAGGPRPLLALEGPPGPWIPAGFDVVAQRGGGLDQRLGAAFEDAGGPALLIGMDTPQVSAPFLRRCLGALAEPGVDAVLGPATDGGWWALGLRRPTPAAVLGVPMSTADTGRHQRDRLRSLGWTVGALPVLRDVDRWEDALSVPVHPSSAFAAAVASAQAAIASAQIAMPAFVP